MAKHTGSPADAGIGPYHWAVTQYHSRFPRRRGDRPAMPNGDKTVSLVPPHTGDRPSLSKERLVFPHRRGQAPGSARERRLPSH